MHAALLPDRSVLRVTGAPARHFLNNLVTTDIEKLAAGEARYAALLTPQGKIAVDFFVVAAADGDGEFYIDCPAELAAELRQKLTFYRLRAKVSIDETDYAVLAVWDGNAPMNEGIVFRDPRLPALGLRVLLSEGAARQAQEKSGASSVGAAAYEAYRIGLGVPKGGVDFAYNDAFPHDADLDKLHGVDFRKGCFIGQEVVSRVEHRGTARNRVVPVQIEGQVPGAGATVMAGDKIVGTMGSSAGPVGLAMLRIDRVQDARAAGISLTSEGSTLKLRDGFTAFFDSKEAKAAG